MKADFSRIRRGTGTGYTAVLEQQGRVALDADANEQRFIDERLRRTETIDVIGPFGGPVGDEGFAITVPGSQILIGPGRYYVDGLLAENTDQVSYDAQPVPLPASDPDAAALLAMLPGRQTLLAVYLQVWQRLVTALDDPCLREPALGQADTTAREQTVWRVVARPVKADLGTQPGPFCPALYDRQPAASTGTMTVTTSNTVGDCGCGPVAAAGYQGLENQLYRVEIHAGGDASAATFTWSRENGSVVSAVTGISAAASGLGSVLQVSSLGPDSNLGFGVGQWVELTDDSYLYADPPNAPGTLYQVTAVDKDPATLTVSATVSGIDPGRNARVRRWDQAGPLASAAGVPVAPGTAIELENGISVTFGSGTYQAGDYWTFPARAATGTVEWPPCGSDGNAAQPPTSLVVHEAPLACLYWVEIPVLVKEAAPSQASHASQAEAGTARDALSAITLPLPVLRPPVPFGQVSVEDCRRPFRPLTAAPAIHVRSVSWANDDVLPLDLLAVNGLVVTLDQSIAGPVDGGRFLVTLEAIPEQYVKEPAGVALRVSYVVDSTVGVAGQQLTWHLPPAPAVGYIQQLLAPAAAIGRFTRARVRLLGQAFSVAGAAGPIYLDGRAFGQPGTRSDGTTPRIDLRFPSGDGSLASDLESWFYLAPPLGIRNLTLPAGGAFTAVVAGRTFTGVVPTGSAGATPVTEVEATATFTYPAAAAAQLTVSVTGNPAGATYVSAPETVAISPGSTSVPIPITFSGAPPAGSAPITFTVQATMVSPSAYFQDQEQPATLVPALTLSPAAPPRPVRAPKPPAT
jgi:Family of unknown function (DUF6519)